MPGCRAPTCVRPALATSRPVPQGKLDTVPHTQLVVEGSKTVLEDVLGGSNFTSAVPVTEALGDAGDDALFPFSWASLPVKMMSEQGPGTIIGNHKAIARPQPGASAAAGEGFSPVSIAICGAR
jgi:hypothetical protein